MENERPDDRPSDKICIEVTFRGNKRMYYTVVRGANIGEGDHVIANIEKGSDIGQVTQAGRLAEKKSAGADGYSIIRKASGQDMEKLTAIKKEEDEAFHVCRDKIKRHGLDMHLVEVEKQFDDSKLTCYFLADQRIDFRELVKDLASTFKMRIELRQIGVRDEARRVGGIGVCGLSLCCAAYLKSFDQISTQMARAQHLTINQAKLSGSCGRLKCCLKYELNYYEQVNKAMPDIGATVDTVRGKAVVTGVNALKNLLKVQFTESGVEEFIPPGDLKSRDPRPKNEAAAAPEN
jgi:cell fate regulator YaaT (PSP1 superfamily)